MSPTAMTISTDARAMMIYESQKKSAGISYALWLFLGGLGAHRFYNGRSGTAFAIIAMQAIGFATMFIGVGVVILAAVWIWVLVDAFLIPGWVRVANLNLIASMQGSAATPLPGVPAI